ncbi:hypothetical protein KRP22_009250 [Phytophthora ramorum]|nr:hypothetical protein KRP22_8080 [Phytophthora ramorum]
MSRVSNSVWRVNYLTKQQSEELSAGAQQKKSDDPTVSGTRIGKLHRDSEAFHRHGAARNQGFPNHFVTNEMLKDLDRNNSSSQTKAVEIFSSNDTLDANYVLTSPDHILAQNYCAMNSFLEQRRAPQGLWTPVKHPAPYSVLGGVYEAAPLEKSSSLKSLKEAKARKPRAQQRSVCAQQPDDWLEIRREMQAQLGIVDANERPSTAASSTDMQTHRGVSCFLTAVADTAQVSALVQAPVLLPTEDQRAVRELKTSQRTIGGGAKLAAARGWHQVAAKTEFVVAQAPALGVSHSALMLRPQGKLKQVILPSLQSDGHKRVS